VRILPSQELNGINSKSPSSQVFPNCLGFLNFGLLKLMGNKLYWMKA